MRENDILIFKQVYNIELDLDKNYVLLANILVKESRSRYRDTMEIIVWKVGNGVLKSIRD